MLLTPYVAIHSTLSKEENERILANTQRLFERIQRDAKTVVETECRVDHTDFFVVETEAELNTVAKALVPGGPAVTTSFVGSHIAGIRRVGASLPDAGVAHHMGLLLICNQIRAHGENWIMSGFSGWCEFRGMGTNDYAGFAIKASEEADNTHGSYQPWLIRNESRMRKWAELDKLAGQHEYTKVDCLSLYSIITFLRGKDVSKFESVLLNLRSGMDRLPAIERAYGKTIDELESEWKKWLKDQG